MTKKAIISGHLNYRCGEAAPPHGRARTVMIASGKTYEMGQAHLAFFGAQATRENTHRGALAIIPSGSLEFLDSLLPGITDTGRSIRSYLGFNSAGCTREGCSR